MGWGSTLGGIAGSALGSLAGPPGTLIIGAVGGAAGDHLQDALKGDGMRYTADARRYRTRGGIMLDSRQLQSILAIEDVLRRARLPYPLNSPDAKFGLLQAMVANAYAESLLSPTAVGDNGWSVGLFQCNMKAGAGRGHSKAALVDPRYNTGVILGELVAAQDRFRLVLQRGTTPLELTKLFSTYVERPADQPGEEKRRAAIVVQLFGDVATQTVRA